MAVLDAAHASEAGGVPAHDADPDSNVKAGGPRRDHEAASRRGCSAGFRGRAVALAAVAASILGMLVGLSVGSGGSSQADPTLAPAYVSLQSQLMSAARERDALKADAATATASAQQVAAQQKTMDTREADLDALQVKLDKKAKSLHARALKIKAAATGATSASESAKSPSSGAANSVYYANCSEARAGGAAPVYRGDPGYAAHLDRDGDGVGGE